MSMMSSTATTRLAIGPVVPEKISRHKPWLVLFLLSSLDLGAISVSFGVSIFVWALSHEEFRVAFYLRKGPVLAVFLIAYWALGLYRVIGLSPAEELRRLVLTTSTGFFFLVFITFLIKESAQYSRGMITLAWLLTVILVPVVRLGGRPVLGRRKWFAQPAVILGGGPVAASVIETLRQNPELALRPVAAFDDNPVRQRSVNGVPVAGGLNRASFFCQSMGIDCAIITMPGISREALLKIVRSTRFAFSKLLLVPDLQGISSLWVKTRDLGGILGIEIRDNLLMPEALFLKRMLDLTLMALAMPILLPVCLGLSLLVKLSSAGPVFYSQERIGKNGKAIQVLKFRTMLKNADAVLQKHLEKNPRLWEEWQEDYKLKHDPRITWIGRFLRRSSLDELPQLWNVARGEMSLVGPRPIVEAEIGKFGESWDSYTRVLPGITGLWQVSGRSNLTYDERVQLNEYYGRNWSVWLDLYILFKTIRVVCTLDGAY
jgi:Undecaprenyl-phosphate galactose phosphotransferase WbaP